MINCFVLECNYSGQKLNDNTFPLEEGRKEGRRMDGKTIQ
jgi:hypothetical protein